MSIIQEAFGKDSLAEAWAKVRSRNAGPGVDGVTVGVFGRRLEKNLAEIRQHALGGTYQPDPVLRCHIPKSDGDFRRIGVPTVRDRVAQRALLNALLDKVEPRLHPRSYAYRPGRSVRMAVAEIEHLRDEGRRWTARVDIDLCFDSIPRDRLMRQVEDWVQDDAVTSLISRWMTAGYIDGDNFDVASMGVPQGDVLSPVLSNIYLDRFDRALEEAGERFVRYADDILVLCGDRKSAQRAIIRSSAALAALDLRTDSEKTGVTSFDSGFRYLGTLFVRTMALPAVRIERTDGKAVYASGYDAQTGPTALEVSRHNGVVRVTSSGGRLTERQLCRLAAKELYRARQGRGTAVGLALLEAWHEASQGQSTGTVDNPGPGDWAFTA